MKTISEQDLQILIDEYRRSEDESQLLVAFEKLVEDISSLPRYRSFPKINVSEVAEFCFEKLTRYDITKGKALNYFTTTISCYLAQCKPRLSYQELRKSHERLTGH